MKNKQLDMDELRSEAWQKTHKLWCSIDYLIQERDSKPEAINCKHAWDMILKHISRELVDIKELLKDRQQYEQITKS